MSEGVTDHLSEAALDLMQKLMEKVPRSLIAHHIPLLYPCHPMNFHERSESTRSSGLQYHTGYACHLPTEESHVQLLGGWVWEGLERRWEKLLETPLSPGILLRSPPRDRPAID